MPPTEQDCEIRRVKVWLNAFLPAHIDGLTISVPHGEFAGKTAIPHPAREKWLYLTDQRTFSADLGSGTTSRVHSEIEIDIPGRTIVGPNRGTHRADPTTELLRETFERTGNVARGKTNRIAFELLTVDEVSSPSGAVPVMKIGLKGAVSNPKSPSSRLFGDIDFKGVLMLTIHSPRSVEARFVGMVEPFPAFEMYASADGQPPVTVFVFSPNPGTSTRNLPGWPTRSVDSCAVLTCPLLAETPPPDVPQPEAAIAWARPIAAARLSAQPLASASSGLRAPAGALAAARPSWDYPDWRIGEIKRVAQLACQDPHALRSEDLAGWPEWFPRVRNDAGYSEEEFADLDECARQTVLVLMRLTHGLAPGVAMLAYQNSERARLRATAAAPSTPDASAATPLAAAATQGQYQSPPIGNNIGGPSGPAYGQGLRIRGGGWTGT